MQCTVIMGTVIIKSRCILHDIRCKTHRVPTCPASKRKPVSHAGDCVAGIHCYKHIWDHIANEVHPLHGCLQCYQKNIAALPVLPVHSKFTVKQWRQASHQTVLVPMKQLHYRPPSRHCRAPLVWCQCRGAARRQYAQALACV